MAKKATTKKTGKLVYSKDLSIQNATKFHLEMKSIFKDNNNIEVNINNPESVDLTFIQLLFSLKKSAEKNKKTITFNIKLKKECEALLANAGLTNLF